MSEQRQPRGSEWNDVMEVLGALANTITVRSHYQPNHPAIAQSDAHAANNFTRVLDRIPDLVVALVDGEFIVCERPLPELRRRLHVLADAMVRHDMECIVFQRGMTPEECTILGTALAQPAEEKGRVREQTQGYLAHVLLRFLARAGDNTTGIGTSTAYFVPQVRDALIGAARALAKDVPMDRLGILAVANQIVLSCSSRMAMVEQRSWTRSIDDEATHAANVATLTAMMMLDAGYPQRLCVDATAAALLHDIGHLFLPEAIRGVPEPLLEERDKPVFRNHTFAGAAMLLGAGCSPLWVAAALEHHRGVDSGGYPKFESSEPPHEVVRMIALANFFDKKRTLLHGKADSPEKALRAALELEPCYFGRGLVRRFVKVVGVFPPGTVVELTSLEPAIVLRSNPADPWRPQVKILQGRNAGKLAELRDMHPTEARHRLSIVRAIAPPLLLLADTVAAAPAVAPAPAREEARAAAPRPKEDVEAAARGAATRARAQLGGMDAILDALLTVPTDALVTAMPMPTRLPPAPSYVPAVPRPPVDPPPRMASASPPPRMASAAPPRMASAAPPRMASAAPPAPSSPTALGALGSGASVPRLVADITKLPADRRVSFLLRFVDGTSTIDEILDVSGLPREGTLRLLEELLQRGVIAI